jgi:hypothetical protein
MVIKRSSSYNFTKLNAFVNKNNKSCDDLLLIYKHLNIKNEIDFTKIVNNDSVSYGEFLAKNPKATKKQRIQAVKRFYDKLC